VAHSLSPSIQNAAIAAAGLDGVYIALRCRADDVAATLAAIARAGGGGNITVPHKLRALTVLERSTDAVRRTGACNTFWLEDDRICGDNTDVAGFRVAAERLIGSCAGARVLVLGAGGAARAAVAALGGDGAAEIVVLARSPARARQLADDFAAQDAPVRVVPAGATPAGSFDLVVNATPLGLDPGDPLPLDLATLDARAALDLVYHPGGTRWTRHAAALGVPAADGFAMLLAQGAASFERWWHRSPPLDAMRAALDDAVRNSGPAGHGIAPHPA
jgi:shikimate dehydrogenase